jgi:hypothetical protein
VKQVVFILTFSILSACASSEKSGYRKGIEPDYSDLSEAPGWAYAADGFAVQKNQPVGKKNVYEFYYKRCEPGGDKPFYSKTAYECSESPR